MNYLTVSGRLVSRAFLDALRISRCCCELTPVTRRRDLAPSEMNFAALGPCNHVLDLAGDGSASSWACEWCFAMVNCLLNWLEGGSSCSAGGEPHGRRGLTAAAPFPDRSPSAKPHRSLTRWCG